MFLSGIHFYKFSILWIPACAGMTIIELIFSFCKKLENRPNTAHKKRRPGFAPQPPVQTPAALATGRVWIISKLIPFKKIPCETALPEPAASYRSLRGELGFFTFLGLLGCLLFLHALSRFFFDCFLGVLGLTHDWRS